jgi:hypothetical protein
MSACGDISPIRSQDERRAARLLELGRTTPRRPVDLLLEDLAAHGPGRLVELLDSGPAAVLGPPLEALAGGRATLPQLVALKERCKAAADRDLRRRLERLGGYFTAVAAALVHHRARITSRSAEELEPVLLDLAAATEGPWEDLFARGSSVARQPDRQT